MKAALSAGMLANYAARERTLSTAWKVVRTDGEIFGFTDHDQARQIDGVIYEAFSGFTKSQLSQNALLSVDNMEVQGLFDSAGITDAEVEAGVWDNFYYEIFEYDWSDLSIGINRMQSGWVGQFRHQGGLFVAELRSLTLKLQKKVGAQITPNCRYKLGDENCKVDLDAITEFDVPVTSLTSRRVFVASSLIGDTRQFNWGVITWTTGLNTGFRMDVKSFDDITGSIELQMPMPYSIVAADEFTLAPGCNKLHKTGPEQYLGDCGVIYDNVINFGGEPEVPLAAKSVRLPG